MTELLMKLGWLEVKNMKKSEPPWILYQDPYNENKTWQVIKMKGVYYLKQFICGRQYSRGARCTKAWLAHIGIFEMKIIDYNFKAEF